MSRLTAYLATLFVLTVLDAACQVETDSFGRAKRTTSQSSDDGALGATVYPVTSNDSDEDSGSPANETNILENECALSLKVMHSLMPGEYLAANVRDFELADLENDGRDEVILLLEPAFVCDEGCADHMPEGHLLQPAFAVIGGLYPNDRANFELLSPVPIATVSLAVADVDNDGNKDVVAVSVDSVQVLSNQGGGVFIENTHDLEIADISIPPPQILMADLNADGFLDIVAALRWDDAIGVYLNNRQGGFDSAELVWVYDGPFFGAAQVEPRAMTVLDLDGDADLDIVTSNRLLPNVSILTNDGSGVLSVAREMTFEDGFAKSIYASDWTRDGNIEIVLGGLFGQVTLLESDNEANYMPITLATGTDLSQETLVMDFDHDGWQDAVILDSEGQISLLSNDAPTRPNMQPMIVGNLGSLMGHRTILRSGDLNGDGKPDLVVGSDRVTAVFSSYDCDSCQ